MFIRFTTRLTWRISESKNLNSSCLLRSAQTCRQGCFVRVALFGTDGELLLFPRLVTVICFMIDFYQRRFTSIIFYDEYFDDNVNRK